MVGKQNNFYFTRWYSDRAKGTYGIIKDRSCALSHFEFRTERGSFGTTVFRDPTIAFEQGKMGRKRVTLFEQTPEVGSVLLVYVTFDSLAEHQNDSRPSS